VSTSTYVIAGGQTGRDRLRTLSGVLAATTAALLDRLDIAPTARCLDVGCGGGDVTRLLAERVPRGAVVGVDRDPVKIELARAELSGPVELRVEDIADTVRSGATYDVVYVRFVLSHLSDAAAWVRRLSGLVAPGGLLAVEDVHIRGAFCWPPSAALGEALRIYAATVAANGGDANLGPQLPGHLRAAGLTDIGIEVVQPAALDGDAKQIVVLTNRAIADAAICSGVASAEQLAALADELQAFVDRPDTVVTTAQIVQTWGRRRG
jgi:SAM-dependent methyltransferase